jgi:hypothetical protein
MNITRNVLLTAICVLYSTSHGMAWNEEETHNIITSVAAGNSVLSQTKGDYLSILGFGNGLSTELSWPSSGTITSGSIERWLIEGAKLEDAGKWYQTILGSARSLNHFHNPLQPWSSAGLSDVSSGESSLLWAQDATNQATKVGGDWSWNTIRTYYYTALTSNSDTTRQEYFARTFRGVGHQMHLVQDKSVPAHVRNDSHAQDAMGWRQPDNLNLRLETWAKNNKVAIRQYANSYTASPGSYYPTVSLNVPISGLAPITQLIDADVYTGTAPSPSLAQGLAEYTNANFPSEFTLFAENKATNDPHYFPYPRASSTDMQSYINAQKLPETVIAADQVPDTSFWISKTGDGEVINHFARPGYLSDNLMAGDAQLFRRSFYIDETCFGDYTEKLIPRAVGYSTTLIDYFFRGNIELSLPSKGIYSIAAPNSTGYSEIRVKARNSTTSNEEMSDGTLQLVVKYKMALSDPYQSVPVDAGPEQYIVVTEKNNVRTLSRTGTTDLVFDLTNSPIPFWAVDVSLQVVYHGQLGNEAGAGALGTQDISEPTPIDVVNFMDLVCINNSIMTAGSPAAIAAVDFNHNGLPDYDVYPHGLTNVYLAFNGALASSTNHSATIASIPPGNYGRVFVLGEYLSLPVSVAVALQIPNAQDRFPHSTFGTFVETIEALDNQHYYPLMYDVRGITSWWYAYYTNAPYPANSTCDFSTASPNIAGSVAVSIP